MKPLVKRPRFYIGIAVALIAIPTLIWAIYKFEREEPEDAKAEVVTVGGKQVELFVEYPGPWDVIVEKQVDLNIVRYGVNTWNEAVGVNLFNQPRADDDFFESNFTQELINPNKKRRLYGTVSITLATEEKGERWGGTTRVSYDIKTGGAYFATISMNPLHTYHEDTYKKAVIHELGHALLLGHADSRNEKSIMRQKLNIRGIITDNVIQEVKRIWIKD